MAYIKDPKTGKYIKTDSMPTATVKTSVDTSAGQVKYEKNSRGKYEEKLALDRSENYTRFQTPHLSLQENQQSHQSQ